MKRHSREQSGILNPEPGINLQNKRKRNIQAIHQGTQNNPTTEFEKIEIDEQQEDPKINEHGRLKQNAQSFGFYDIADKLTKAYAHIVGHVNTNHHQHRRYKTHQGTNPESIDSMHQTPTDSGSQWRGAQ